MSGAAGCALSLVAVSALALLLASCKSRPDLARDDLTTDVEYEYSIPQDAARYELSADEKFDDPKLIRYTLPIYPAALVNAEVAPVRITAKLVVNDAGGVDRADFDAAPHGEPERLYMQSIRDAVASWKFTPLRITRAAKQSDGSVVIEKTAKPCSLWYEFRFVVNNGQPTAVMNRRTAE